jgi:subtilisin family serine protease
MRGILALSLCVITGSFAVGAELSNAPAPLQGPEVELFPDAERSFLGARPEATQFTEDHVDGILVLKFVHGTNVRLVDGRFQPIVPDVVAVEARLDALGATRERIWLQSDDELVAWRRSGEARSGRPLHDLTQFFHIRLPQGTSVAAACDALNRYDAVELAYPLGTGGDPVAPALGGTPDFEDLQDYREPAPNGIDAIYGNSFPGGTGAGTIIADCETGWTDDHEDLIGKAAGNYIGLTPLHYPWDHGTAVLGELVGEDNGFGVKGICHGADIRMSTHQGSSANFATAIQAAVDAVGVGDAVVIEIQCSGGPPGPYPCEYAAATYAVVETATANGIHVYAAAGNGDNDLDQAAYGGLFNKAVRDSGAVMVGASDGVLLNKASFSNYGSRLDAHGWGWDVVTAGYGTLQSGPVTEEYSDSFSGTSRATPIVTGAGVILNSIHETMYGSPLDPLALRDLLTATGTPHGTGGQIGPRPDLRAAIDAMIGAAISYCTAGTSASGCQVLLSAMGTPSATAPSGFDLQAWSVEGGKDALYFYAANGRQAISWGNGTSYQCVLPPVRRAGLLTGSGTTGTCDGAFTQDLNARWSAKPAHNPGAGAVVQAQLWYRDPQNTSNRRTSLSNALEFSVMP